MSTDADETPEVPEDSLTGVIRPVSYIVPEGEEDETDDVQSPFERAKAEAESALIMTRERLAELRKMREVINAEIKQLVDEEDLLSRMTKVKKSTKAT